MKSESFLNNNDPEFGKLSVSEKMSQNKDLTLSELISAASSEDGETGKKGEMAAVEVEEEDNAAICGFCHKGALPKPLEGGKLYRVGSLVCHYFCMLFTFNSKQLGEDNEGLFGFSLAEVSNHMELGGKRRCRYCLVGGANTNTNTNTNTMQVLPGGGRNCSVRQETLRTVDAFPVRAGEGSNFPVQREDDDLLHPAQAQAEGAYPCCCCFQSLMIRYI